METEVEDRGRVTIPAKIRHALGITRGEKLDVSARDGEIILKRKKVVRASDIQGIIGPLNVNIEEIEEAPGEE